MFKPPARILQRQALMLSRRQPPNVVRGARHLSIPSTATGSRSWKNTFLRWGLAAGAVYYYNSSNVFAEEPRYPATTPLSYQNQDSSLDDLDAVSARSRQRRLAQSADNAPSPQTMAVHEEPTTAQEYEEEEEEAENQGAFNPETGEINWDCPCLGGMAHGPCGGEFRAAFSCFVYSKEEPKGVDCIENFKHMQDCFRKHPDVYSSELDEDDAEINEASAAEGQAEHATTSARTADTHAPSSPTSSSPAPAPGAPSEDKHGEKVAHVRSSHSPAPAEAAIMSARTSDAHPPSSPTSPSPPAPIAPSEDAREEKVTHVRSGNSLALAEVAEAKQERARNATQHTRKPEPESESAELVPKAAHDGR